MFAAEVKPHLVHEAVRAEQNALRAGTAATKSRGLVSGGRAKPWRQKGTGRARQGTIRAPQFTGGGHAFAKVPRTFVQKVNRKAAKAALRAAFASHASAGTLAIVSRRPVRCAFDEGCEGPPRRPGARARRPSCRAARRGERREVVPQPRARRRDLAERARGRRGRLGALARDHRVGARRGRQGGRRSGTRPRSSSRRSSPRSRTPRRRTGATRSGCIPTRTRRRSARPSRSSSTSRSSAST